MNVTALLTGAIFIIMSFTQTVDIAAAAAQNTTTLSAKQQSIATISALGAKGHMEKLKISLAEGLDAGLTVNEIKEFLVQLYAYAGFPRSLNALTAFQAVVNERKAKGIHDVLGKEASPLPTDRSSLAFGTENQTKLIGQPIGGGIYDFAPAIDQFLKAHLFGDIFQRDNVDWQSRELATIAILASIDGLAPQLQGHMHIGLHNGLTSAQIKETIALLEPLLGSASEKKAQEVLEKVLNKQQ